MTEKPEKHKDHTLIIRGVGVILLLIGVVAALYAPAEMYCFYLFSDGGRFHFDGFGFGSLIFAGIAWQIIAYYLIAVVFIPLGIGHLRLRRWARIISISLMWCAWIVGAPLIVVFMSMLSVKRFSPASTILVAAVLALAYLFAPGLLIRFYKSEDVRQTFESGDEKISRIDRLPMPILVLSILFGFYVIILHVPIFFNGLFPMFGIWLSGLRGVLAWDISIMCLACLTWGVWRQKVWAWWGSAAYFGVLAGSLVVTLIQSSFSKILSMMKFPPTEMKLLERIPLQGVHFIPFFGIPLVITLCLIIKSKRHFKTHDVGE